MKAGNFPIPTFLYVPLVTDNNGLIFAGVRFEECPMVRPCTIEKLSRAVHILWRCGPGCGRRRKNSLSEIDTLRFTSPNYFADLRLSFATLPAPEFSFAASRTICRKARTSARSGRWRG